jgi:hypothetical protein
MSEKQEDGRDKSCTYTKIEGEKHFRCVFCNQICSMLGSAYEVFPKAISIVALEDKMRFTSRFWIRIDG